MDVFRKELRASEKMLRAMKLDTSKVSLLTEDAADADRGLLSYNICSPEAVLNLG